MSQDESSPDFIAKINKIVNYFSRTKKGGFLFCSCDNTQVIKQIVRDVIFRAAEKNIKVKELYLSYTDTGSFLYQIKAITGDKPDGVIVSNLDEAIILTKDQIITDINLSRDILLGLKLPFLFCMSQENISKFANKASDFFLRRDRGVVQFTDIPEHPIGIEIKGLFPIEFQKSTDLMSLNLKIGLLHAQLKEAEEKKYGPDRIANEIALDLINAYLDASLIEKANELFDRYKPYFNLKEHAKAITVNAWLYASNLEWDKSLTYYFKLKAMHEAVGNMHELAVVLNKIAAVYFHKGDMDKALEYFNKTGDLCEREGIEAWKGSVLNNIGLIYSARDELDKALGFFLKSIEISEKIGDVNSLGNAFNNIGEIYARKGEWHKAYDYYRKGKEVLEKSGDIQHLKVILKNIGYAKDKKGTGRK
ncbi:MAG TPA: tetratricopeptide repeat protein [Candidatus Deferrimicrobium sp.]|nr:tetratricopeptide repeat protein [Candidatus Deferrimicrobium sp.]